VNLEPAAVAVPQHAHATSASAGESIRPFTARVPKGAIDDLRKRLAATRWPGKELVADRSQGVQLATIKALVRYWATD
jgi:hypothetical protein